MAYTDVAFRMNGDSSAHAGRSRFLSGALLSEGAEGIDRRRTSTTIPV